MTDRSGSGDWWPSLAQFHGIRARAERKRWSIQMARLSQRTGLKVDVLRRFERGGIVPIPGIKERVYWALRRLILEHARRMIVVLEAVEGAENPPPLMALAEDAPAVAAAPPSFVARLDVIASDVEAAAAIERAKSGPTWDRSAELMARFKGREKPWLDRAGAGAAAAAAAAADNTPP